jgi:hypothetical protein
MDRAVQQIDHHVAHGGLALGGFAQHAGLFQHRVQFGRGVATIGAGRMPQGVKDVRVISGPSHHIHGVDTLGCLVFLADAGVHGSDVHDLDIGLDADLGQLRLEHLGQTVACRRSRPAGSSPAGCPAPIRQLRPAGAWPFQDRIGRGAGRRSPDRCRTPRARSGIAPAWTGRHRSASRRSRHALHGPRPDAPADHRRSVGGQKTPRTRSGPCFPR